MGLSNEERIFGFLRGGPALRTRDELEALVEDVSVPLDEAKTAQSELSARFGVGIPLPDREDATTENDATEDALSPTSDDWTDPRREDALSPTSDDWTDPRRED